MLPTEDELFSRVSVMYDLFPGPEGWSKDDLVSEAASGTKASTQGLTLVH